MVLHKLPEAPSALSIVAERVALLEAAAPALVMLSLLFVLGASYTLRGVLVGEYHDEEMDQRGLGGLTNRGVRHFFAWAMRPLWRGLAALSVPPNALTTLNLGLSLASGMAAATGYFALAGWLFMGGGVLDFLDGRLARETAKATRSGAALDSVVDRYSECALLVGLSCYYAGSWVLGAALLALTGSLLVPYVRARSESLGVALKDVGIMQRPERMLLLGFGVTFAPVLQAIVAPDEPRPSYYLAAAALLVLAVFSHWTAAQRLLHLMGALRSERERPEQRLLVPRTLAIGALSIAVDYSVMHALVVSQTLARTAATGLACAIGVLVAVGGKWSSLGAGDRGAYSKRAAFVAVTSALLNAGGVALAGVLANDLDYRVAWLVVRAAVLAVWNLPLVREFGVEPAPALWVGAPRTALRAAALARAPRRVRRSDARIATL